MAESSSRYRSTLAVLDRHVADLAHRRVDTATARINRGALPEFREFDLLFGLTGIGALLLHRNPGGSALEQVLTYLVTLTRPLAHEEQQLPGWWVGHDPAGPEHPMPGGHGNLGTAHGITGPLLLLSQAARRDITVPGQHEAITTVLDWLDTWRQDSPAGPWWPEHLTRADLHTGRPTQSGPYRPSWCYGTPGITRAGQLAAIATTDPARQRQFEDALSACLADPEQLDKITDAGLCHGWAGLYQTTWRAASDATTPALHTALPRLAAELVRHSGPGAGPGFLEGDAGTALALTTAATGAPTSGWDACLLID
ncbi:lanthionine synthetase C family protein [Kitasatospora sp. Root107]|uniref:lanthionine synthetase C family protein n=1 Tax=Kitasatospora sp. Root107 TaxID=1736424 RepID=UPI003513957E